MLTEASANLLLDLEPMLLHEALRDEEFIAAAIDHLVVNWIWMRWRNSTGRGRHPWSIAPPTLRARVSATGPIDRGSSGALV